MNSNNDLSLKKQLQDYWDKVGLFSRVCFLINVLAYLYQISVTKDLVQYAICLGPIVDASQFYRIITSEFTHANPAHIVFNMAGLLAFGVEVEKTYGTAFYFVINIMLIIVSVILSMTFYVTMVFLVPPQYRGGPENLFQCGVGYSNVLFGIAMIFAYVGDPYQNFFGLCRFEKKYIPWFYMLAIYVTIPESSFIGHFCGLIAGLLIKFAGLYFFMPRY